MRYLRLRCSKTVNVNKTKLQIYQLTVQTVKMYITVKASRLVLIINNCFGFFLVALQVFGNVFDGFFVFLYLSNPCYLSRREDTGYFASHFSDT